MKRVKLNSFWNLSNERFDEHCVPVQKYCNIYGNCVKFLHKTSSQILMKLILIQSTFATVPAYWITRLDSFFGEQQRQTHTMVLLLYRRLFVVIIILTINCFVARQVYSSETSPPKHRNVLFLLGTKYISDLFQMTICFSLSIQLIFDFCFKFYESFSLSNQNDTNSHIFNGITFSFNEIF